MAETLSCEADTYDYEVSPEVPEVAQPTSKTCWLACYKMMCLWKGRDFEEAVKRLKKAGIDTTVGLQPEDLDKARKVVGTEGWKVSTLKTKEGMMNALETYGPIWCAGYFIEGSLHAIVLHGYQLYKRKKLRLRLHDPWEIYYDRRSDMSHEHWCELVLAKSFACQIWW